MSHKAFDNVRNQIGVCGIWCGSCTVGNGSLREAAACYDRALEGHGVRHWAPKSLDYAAYRDGHATVQEIACCRGCRQGGGRDDCEMRHCATIRNLGECAACCDFEACPHGEGLEAMRRGALDAGLFVKTEPEGGTEFVEASLPKLTRSFPTCVLFLEEEEIPLG